MLKTVLSFKNGFPLIKIFCNNLMYTNNNPIRFLLTYYYFFAACFATLPVVKIQRYQMCIVGGISSTVLVEFLIFVFDGESRTHPALHIVMLIIISLLIYIKIISLVIGIASWSFMLAIFLSLIFRKSVLLMAFFLFLVGIFLEFASKEISLNLFMNKTLILALGVAMVVTINIPVYSFVNLNIAVLPCILISAIIFNYIMDMVVIQLIKERKRRIEAARRHHQHY